MHTPCWKQALRHINRASWTVVAALLVALMAPVAAGAAEQCQPAQADGTQRCAVGLQAPQISRMQLTQEQSKWCWAASLAMVFAHHGLVVSQEQIVQRQFGSAWDLAVPTSAITRLLGMHWQDRGGRGFAPLATVMDRAAGQSGLGDASVVQELAQQRPLIVAALGHAMVLVQVEFERLPLYDGVRITGGTVIDPAPGRGVRRLQPRELDANYLAAVQLAVPQNVASLAGAAAIAQ